VALGDHSGRRDDGTTEVSELPALLGGSHPTGFKEAFRLCGGERWFFATTTASVPGAQPERDRPRKLEKAYGHRPIPVRSFSSIRRGFRAASGEWCGAGTGSLSYLLIEELIPSGLPEGVGGPNAQPPTTVRDRKSRCRSRASVGAGVLEAPASCSISASLCGEAARSDRAASSGGCYFKRCANDRGGAVGRPTWAVFVNDSPTFAIEKGSNTVLVRGFVITFSPLSQEVESCRDPAHLLPSFFFFEPRKGMFVGLEAPKRRRRTSTCAGGPFGRALPCVLRRLGRSNAARNACMGSSLQFVSSHGKGPRPQNPRKRTFKEKPVRARNFQRGWGVALGQHLVPSRLAATRRIWWCGVEPASTL